MSLEFALLLNKEERERYINNLHKEVDSVYEEKKRQLESQIKELEEVKRNSQRKIEQLRKVLQTKDEMMAQDDYHKVLRSIQNGGHPVIFSNGYLSKEQVAELAGLIFKREEKPNNLYYFKQHILPRLI